MSNSPLKISAQHLTALLWLVLMAVALYARPLMPVDETRYLAVAWDMWLDGNYLVPHLNGTAYSDKPPLLFWLMNAGWWVFGVNEWWPRLVAPLFGLASLYLTARLADALWPGERLIRETVPLILFASLFWTLFTSLTMFDMMLAVFTLLGILGMLKVWRLGDKSGWVMLILAIGFGALAKGPAILLHLLPVAFTAPWWAPKLSQTPDNPIVSWRQWYVGVLVSVVLGTVIGLAWAIPAGMSGGEEYRNAIFWGQSAGRIVNSFAHQRGWWWYLMIIPVMLLPWTIWPPFWRALKRRQTGFLDGGVRLCVVWFGFALVVFSLISGKQPHYLLPEFPVLALVIARGVFSKRVDTQVRQTDGLLPGLMAVILIAAAFVTPWVSLSDRMRGMVDLASPFWMLLVVVPVMILAFYKFRCVKGQVMAISVLSMVLLVAIHLTARPLLFAQLDLRPMALQLAKVEKQGRAISHFGKYHGQYHFLGRLTRPFEIVGDQEIKQWADKNPNGGVVAQQDFVPKNPAPDFWIPFRRYVITLWDVSKVKDNIMVVKRP